MALTKEKKKEIYAGLTDAIKNNPSFVFVNFHKLNVANAMELRRTLRANGVKYVVAKKTLIRKALTEGTLGSGAKIIGEMPALDGEVALAYSTDLTAPAREIYAFQKKLEDQVSIIGGVFEGMYKTKEDMMAIALIPSLNTLYAQFANVINSPIQGFVMALSQIAKAMEAAAPAAGSVSAPAAPEAPASAAPEATA